MKKTSSRKAILKTAAIVLLLTVFAMTLVSCNKKLSGTYRSEGLIAQTFTFDGDKVTMSAFGINASGTYKIDGGKIVITYTLLGQELDWSQSFSGSGKTITIGGTVFTKE